MKVKLSVQGVAGNIRQAIAIVGLAESSTNTVHLPGNIRGIMLAASSALLIAEHFVDGLQGALTQTQDWPTVDNAVSTPVIPPAPTPTPVTPPAPKLVVVGSDEFNEAVKNAVNTANV